MQLKLEILNGIYSSEDRIPSLNELVQRFSISKITARRVHEELRQAGMVQTECGRGAFVKVADTPQQATPPLQPGDEVAMLVDHDAERQLPAFLRGMQQHRPDLALRYTIHLTGDSELVEEQLLNRLFEEGVRHFVVLPVLGHTDDAPNLNLPAYQQLVQRGAKLVLGSCQCHGVGIMSLGWNLRELARRMIHAYRQTNARAPILIYPGQPCEGTAAILEAFRESMGGSSQNPQEIEFHPLNGPWEMQMDTAQMLIGQQLRRKTSLDAVFCVGPRITQGVAHALEQLETSLRFIHVFGCGVLDFDLNLINYPVHYFESNPSVMGQVALDRLAPVGGESDRGLTHHVRLDQFIHHQGSPSPAG